MFDRNADDATGDMPSMDMTYASAKNLTANSYSRTGYIWNGWNTQADGRGISYRNRQSVSNLVTADNGSVTLYAQWVPNTYTIKFVDGHDGTAIKSAQFEYGSAITAPNAPEHAGYTATGWDKTPGNVTGDEMFTMSYEKITQEDSGNKNGNENAVNNNNGNENINHNIDKNDKDSTDQLQDGLQSILQTGVDIIVSPLAIAAASISAALAAIFRRRS